MFTDSDALKLALSLKLPEDYTSLIKIIYGTILDKKPEIDLKDICNNFYKNIPYLFCVLIIYK